MSVFHYCPTCLNSQYGDESKKFKCDFCGSEMISSGADTLRKAKIIKEEIKSGAEFNQTLFDSRQRLEIEEYEQKVAVKKEQELAESKSVHCPVCGSTQIQMVPRKWSLLAGFATNKVDRVCVNCKRKF